jgi:hypothetical protein
MMICGFLLGYEIVNGCLFLGALNHLIDIEDSLIKRDFPTILNREPLTLVSIVLLITDYLTKEKC